ncbi:MAG TPA: dihydropteroate synthase [Rhodocyclaceae bacterium]|nr:dihydropteroate synthase [Rhodocyclaceae bacterium]
MQLSCGRYTLSFERPLIMGIVNVTADSFSGDGHARAGFDDALRHAQQLLAEGADILDLGGESSRPGAVPVSETEEIARIVPLVEALRDCGVPLSIDTVKPAVMRAALAAGADMINDIAALSAPGALEAVAASKAAVCLMHMQGTPGTMQLDPQYADVVQEVTSFLAKRVAAAEAAGIDRDRIVLDPGFGFGKTLHHNADLFKALPDFKSFALPVLVGVSRKSMLGQITGREVGERLPASVAAAMLAVQNGAAIVRVHDVAATKDALAVLSALK